MEERVEAIIMVVGMEEKSVESIASGCIIPRIAHQLREVSKAKIRPHWVRTPVIGVEAWNLAKLHSVLGTGEADFTPTYYEAKERLFIAADSAADHYLDQVKEMLEEVYKNKPEYERRPKIMRLRDIIMQACTRRGATKIQVVATDSQFTDLIERAAEAVNLEVRRSNAQLQRQLATMFYEANLDLGNGGRRNAFENFSQAVESSLKINGADLMIVGGEYSAFAQSLTEDVPIVGLSNELVRFAVDWAFDKIFSSNAPPPPSC